MITSVEFQSHKVKALLGENVKRYLGSMKGTAPINKSMFTGLGRKTRPSDVSHCFISAARKDLQSPSDQSDCAATTAFLSGGDVR